VGPSAEQRPTPLRNWLNGSSTIPASVFAAAISPVTKTLGPPALAPPSTFFFFFRRNQAWLGFFLAGYPLSFLDDLPPEHTLEPFLLCRFTNRAGRASSVLYGFRFPAISQPSFFPLYYPPLISPRSKDLGGCIFPPLDFGSGSVLWFTKLVLSFPFRSGLFSFSRYSLGPFRRLFHRGLPISCLSQRAIRENSWCLSPPFLIVVVTPGPSVV